MTDPQPTREARYADMQDGELLRILGDDASKWAAAFCEIARSRGLDIDEGWMIGWFANAIEHSSDVRRFAAQHSTVAPSREAREIAEEIYNMDFLDDIARALDRFAAQHPDHERIAAMLAQHSTATPDPQPTRWTMEQLDDLKAELNRRHLLDPLWRRCADAIGSLQFDLVDAQHSEHGEWVSTATLDRLQAAAQRSTAAPVSGDAREELRLIMHHRFGTELSLEEAHHLASYVTAAKAEARQEERERIHEQGWCYQHQRYHRNYVCEHDHGALAPRA